MLIVYRNDEPHDIEKVVGPHRLYMPVVREQALPHTVSCWCLCDDVVEYTIHGAKVLLRAVIVEIIFCPLGRRISKDRMRWPVTK